jgi:predicted RNase H-like nuclease
MRFLGIDGCRGGWAVVLLSGSVQELWRAENITDALKGGYDVAMIDIPVGIPEKGYRECDLEARRLLGNARSRVFLGARRFVLNSKSREEAHEAAVSLGAPGVSCQLFCISPKIIEVDAFVRARKPVHLHETHPELVFYRLNNCQPVAPKKGKTRRQGLCQRRDLMAHQGFRHIDVWLETRPPGVGRDDVLDACACAVAARDRKGALPSRPVWDDHGIAMQMWY